MHNFQSNFHLRQLVCIDNQYGLIGYITAVTFREAENLQTYPVYQVDWLHNGQNQSFSIEGWRLTVAG